jgi:hypothetical protein
MTSENEAMDSNEAPLIPAPATLSEQVRKVLAEAAKPLTVKQVKERVDKLFPKGTKAVEKPSAAGVQGELERGGAFKHPVEKKSGEPTYWNTAYVPPLTPAEVVAKAVREKVAALGIDEVVSDKQLGKPSGKKLTDETAKAFDETLAELIAAGVLHRHGKNYGKTKPLSVAEQVAATVRAKVAALTDYDVVAEGKLGKPSGKSATEEAKQAFAEVVEGMIKSGELHRHGKNYGKQPLPKPKWYETDQAKKAFTALVNAAKKVVGVHAPADEVFALLRQRIAEAPAVEKPKPVVPSDHVHPAPPVAPTADLRTVLKQAYDDLCEFVEFRDKLVELPRLYREASKRMPGLTPDAFQAELWEMGKERVIELSVINDERAATHPELAIRRHDSLYFYARWN